jgi:hypothetical protein
MTLRSLMATNCLLVGWIALGILTCSAPTASAGPWPGGLPERWFLQLGCVAGVTIGFGVLFRRHPKQSRKKVVADLPDSSGHDRLAVSGMCAEGERWREGLFGILWLP